MKKPLDAGVSRLFVGHPYSDVVIAARSAIRDADLALDGFSEPDSSTTVYLGRMGAHSLGYGASTAGEFARVVVHLEGSDSVRVFVLSRRRVAFNLVARGDYSKTLFELIDDRLKTPDTPRT